MFIYVGETEILIPLTMKQLLFLLLIFQFIFPLAAQERPLNTGLSNEDQYSFIGMTIADVFEKFGPPRTVAAARGAEIWQDDVIFNYTGVDFYFYRDRVWQVKFVTTHGVSNGDRKRSVLLTLGEKAEDNKDHILVPVEGKDWSLMMRINFNNTENVNAIFLYRADF